MSNMKEAHLHLISNIDVYILDGYMRLLPVVLRVRAFLRSRTRTHTTYTTALMAAVCSVIQNRKMKICTLNIFVCFRIPQCLHTPMNEHIYIYVLAVYIASDRAQYECGVSIRYIYYNIYIFNAIWPFGAFGYAVRSFHTLIRTFIIVACDVPYALLTHTIHHASSTPTTAAVFCPFIVWNCACAIFILLLFHHRHCQGTRRSACIHARIRIRLNSKWNNAMRSRPYNAMLR